MPSDAPRSTGFSTLTAPTADDILREARRIAGEGLGIGVLLALFFGVMLGGIASEHTGHFAPGFLLPAAAIAAFILARAWVTASTYSLTVEPPPSALTIGGRFTWGVHIQARRELTLATATVTLRCQEHAAVRSGKSVSHYRRSICERQYRLPARRLEPGQTYEVRPEIEVPRNAIPSWGEGNHRIEWTVEVQVPTDGLCANINEKASLNVVPRIVEAGHEDDRHVPLHWLAEAPVSDGRTGRITPGGVVGPTAEKLKGITVVGEGVVASLEVTDGLASDHGPLLAAGTTRELKLIVEPQEAIHCRGLRVWIGCELGGKGVPERIGLFGEESVWSGDLSSGQPVEAPIRITVPRHGPVTYAAEYVWIRWFVRVRVDVPMWRDRVVALPFVVTPQAVRT